MTVSEFFHGRNKSEVTIETCFSWNPPGTERSGMTMIAVDIPSGYEFEWTAAYDVMGLYPGLLVNFDKRPGKTLWYLDYVPTEETCFQVLGIITFVAVICIVTRTSVGLKQVMPKIMLFNLFLAHRATLLTSRQPDPYKTSSHFRALSSRYARCYFQLLFLRFF